VLKLPDVQVRTADQYPELVPRIAALSRQLFPTFVFKGDQAVDTNWEPFLEAYPGYQLALFADEEMVAAGVTAPMRWDGSVESLPDVFSDIFPKEPQDFNTLCALAGLVDPRFQGQGLSRKVLIHMKEIAIRHDMSSFVVPVRPTHKERYPLILLTDYIEWRREDGYLYDPWLRVHERLGASVLGILPVGVQAEGTVTQWESWTGMRFLSSGSYVVPGALNPLEIDVEQDKGTYIEPNVWMLHPL
jgi:GNAT superfamily N-acetyltransferase